MKALVTPKGCIIDIVPDDGEFPVHKDLSWVSVPDGTTTRETIVNGAVVKEPDRTKEAERAALLSELAGLDRFIPRAIEDMWTATGFDVKSLPAIQQERLARKAALRSVLAQV